MKFKLFGIEWDFTIIFEMIWGFIGGMLILLPFTFGKMPWWAVLISIFLFIIYVATANSVADKFRDAKK